jgi:hypothetical protein
LDESKSLVAGKSHAARLGRDPEVCAQEGNAQVGDEFLTGVAKRLPPKSRSRRLGCFVQCVSSSALAAA